MINFFKKMLCGVRLIGNGWRRGWLIVEGVLFLLLAGMIGASVIPIEEDSEPTLKSLPNYDYIDEVKNLAATSIDEAKQLARYIFETEGMPNQDEARRIYDEIEKEQKGWWNRTKRAASGFVTGEGESIEELGGSVDSDMFLYGDVRDLIKHSYYKVTKNDKGDAFVMALSMFGLITEFVDVVDWAPAVLKGFRKAGALSTKMVGLLGDGINTCLKTRKVDKGFKTLLGEIKSMTDSLGFARASRVMAHADTAADVGTLAKASRMAPDETYLLVKHSGKDGLHALDGLTKKKARVLREAARKGPDALKNLKKYSNELKEKTATPRRLARLIKSFQSGHLTGLVKKLVLAIPFLRFAVAALAILCLLFSVRKFWLAVSRPPALRTGM